MPEEIDAPTEGFENSFILSGDGISRVPPVWDRACEGRDGGILGLRQRFLQGCPGGDGGMTSGAGRAYYLAADSDAAFYRAFYRDLFEKTGLHNPLGAELPYGVTVTERTAPDGRGLLFVMNFSTTRGDPRVRPPVGRGERRDGRRDPGDAGPGVQGPENRSGTFRLTNPPEKNNLHCGRRKYDNADINRL